MIVRHGQPLNVLPTSRGQGRQIYLIDSCQTPVTVSSVRVRHLIVLVCIVGLLCGGLAAPAGAAETCPGDEDDADPSPYMSVSKPASATVGESVTIEVTGWNFGAPGDKYSTVSISAPTLDEADDGEQVRVVSDTFAYTETVPAGGTVWNEEGEAQTAEYLLVEGGTLANDGWCEGDSRSLTVEFTPEEAGTFPVYIRTTQNQSDNTYTYPYPGNHDGTTGQQGFRVKTYEIDIEPEGEVNATITDTQFGSGDYERGDTVQSSVTVENTGDREHTYYVGYSVYDPNGKMYNSDAATTVTLAPGGDRTIDLEWEVPDGASAGAYDPRVSVWQESDPDNLDNRLADYRGTGPITVREEPSINATITNTDIDDGEYRDDETVDARVQVENTGNREHTYFVGYSVTGPDGAIYDAPGETVTLVPGSTERVDLEWEIPGDVNAGYYDARVSVWKGSDPTNLQTRLADVDRVDQFEVRPQETVIFTVSKAASMEGYEVEGEPIADATIGMRGYDYTADEDGEVRVEFPVDNYEYTVSAEGYESESGTLRMTANAGTQYEYIALEREGVETLTVDVVDNASEPLAANTYDIRVDGEPMTPDARGQLRVETGEHTVTVVPTDFGKTEGVERVEKQVTVDENGASVTLRAVPKQYTLAVDVPEEGGSVTVGDSEAVSSDVSRSYEEGTTVTVTAEPAVGYEFDGWEGDYPSGEQTRQSVSIALDADTSLTPEFTSTGEQTIVGYDPQTGEFENYTVSREPGTDFDSASATLPEGTSWSDVAPPADDYNKRNVSSTGSYPWSAVGQIVYGDDGGCSATVIEDNHVITAGHCIYKDERGWMTNSGDIKFIPGRNGGERPFRNELSPRVEVEYIQTYKQWADEMNQAYDVAVLTLDRDVGAETGTFAYEGRAADAAVYGEDWDLIESDTGLHTTGYPSAEAPFVTTGTAQWDVTAVGEGTDNCGAQAACHQIATGGANTELLYSGHSGASVWIADGTGRPMIVSVVSSSPTVEWKPDNLVLADPKAVRISERKYSDIGKMVQKGNEVNLEPVANLTATPTPATVGEQVTLDASGSVDPDGSIETYKWNLNPETGVDRTTSTPRVTYTYESTHEDVQPAVQVTDSDGKLDTASSQSFVVRSAGNRLTSLNVSITDISKCGQLCRDISYTIENPTNQPVTDLTVNATIISGGETVWTGDRTFTELSPGQTPAEATVDLDPSDALTVNENDGKVTVVLEVTAGGEERTFRFKRQVN